MVTENDLIAEFKRIIAKEANLSEADIDIDKEFSDYKLDSINALHILESIETYLGYELHHLLFWEYPTIRLFAEHVVNTPSA